MYCMMMKITRSGVRPPGFKYHHHQYLLCDLGKIIFNMRVILIAPTSQDWVKTNQIDICKALKHHPLTCASRTYQSPPAPGRCLLSLLRCSLPSPQNWALAVIGVLHRRYMTRSASKQESESSREAARWGKKSEHWRQAEGSNPPLPSYCSSQNLSVLTDRIGLLKRFENEARPLWCNF